MQLRRAGIRLQSPYQQGHRVLSLGSFWPPSFQASPPAPVQLSPKDLCTYHAPARSALTPFLPGHSCFFLKPPPVTCTERKCTFSEAQLLSLYAQDLNLPGPH